MMFRPSPLLLLLIVITTAASLAAQLPTGFITIDCGIDPSTNYTDPTTNLSYTSDSTFISTGTNFNVAASHLKPSLPRQLSTLRSFPIGSRNCYTLTPIQTNLKHLIRATFYYGNYDGLNSATPERPLQFDVYLGVNKWVTVNFTNASEGHSTEVIAVAKREFVSVCLVNTENGTPFISLIEVRPLKNGIYPIVNASCPLILQYRGDIGSATNLPVRYPDDPYDRVWKPNNNMQNSHSISSPFTVDNRPDDLFEAPSAVLRTAATPVNSTTLYFTYTAISSWAGISGHTRSQYYFVMHFAELQSISARDSRVFSIYVNGDLMNGPYSPSYLLSGYIYNNNPQILYQYSFSILKDNGSTLRPILNAIEIYTVMLLPETETNDGDVDAIIAIKEQYLVKRNWAGDPCSPSAYAWDGLICNYSAYGEPRIINLNLSLSGLNGEIKRPFASLAALRYLDLSYNNLTGTIPDFIVNLASLELLNLSGNQLTGSIPQSLLQRSEEGSLILRTDGNPNMCINWNSCEPSKKKNIILPIIVICSLISTVLLSSALLYVLIIRRRNPQGSTSGTRVIYQKKENSEHILDCEENPFPFERQQFTYKDLEKITKNFEQVIGKGAFGTVYYGCLEDGSEVAVKMHSQSSPEAAKQILAEAQFLVRIHHRNLITLVGYCNDKNGVALVFEYMAQGNLAENLSGTTGNERNLSWENRLRVALDVAQGLEYLHKGCRPAIVHRDVKSSNILLNHKLEAKIADFGLSKAFHSDSDTHISTMMAGTLGYLDPEYHVTFQLTVKSDVYSFGVVLLELITGQPAILTGTESVHIFQWVNLKLAKWDISGIVDPRLRGDYNVNSAWKVTKLALNCMAQSSSKRPIMSEVVLQLKEDLELEVPDAHVEALKSSRSSLFEIASELEVPDAHIEALKSSRSSSFEIASLLSGSTRG